MPKKKTLKEAEFRKLIERYVSGEATGEEVRLLNLYYEQFDDKPNVLDRVSEEEQNETGERIRRKIAENTSGVQGKVVRFGKMWSSAAAVVVIFLAVGAAYLINRSHEPEVVAAKAVEVSTDALPGGNKAILTLADGTQFILDSASNGALTQQGSVTVIKIDDGQLAYQPKTNSEANAVEYNTVATPKGGQYQLILSDGTKVWLNAASTLRFPAAFTGASREVELSGEGYFEVARNEAKPFLVSAGDAVVRVLGTHFNIHSYDDEAALRTTLLEGKVEISKGEKKVIMKPGQQVHVERATGSFAVKNNVDTEQATAWKNGYFSFQGASLKDVMRQISRWYDVEIHYEGTIAPRTFGGGITRDSQLADVLKILEESDVHFRLEGKNLFVKQ